MAKKRFQCMLSDEALAELERRAGAPDKRQAYLERLLTAQRDMRTLTNDDLRVADATFLGGPVAGLIEEVGLAEAAKQARTERKAERAERKADLQAAVSSALASKSAEANQIAMKAFNARPCPIHSPKWCEATCKHRRN